MSSTRSPAYPFWPITSRVVRNTVETTRALRPPTRGRRTGAFLGSWEITDAREFSGDANFSMVGQFKATECCVCVTATAESREVVRRTGLLLNNVHRCGTRLRRTLFGEYLNLHRLQV